MRKPIFLLISRGFLMRNILRSGVLAGLTGAGQRVVVIFPLHSFAESVPQYLRDEFRSPNVELIGVPVHYGGRWYKLFCRVTNFLVFTESTLTYLRVAVTSKSRSRFFVQYLRIAYGFLSRFSWLKRLARAAERRFFRFEDVAMAFDRYRPALVFSTSVISTFDTMFMAEAARRGIPSASMPKGWDNISKLFYRAVPDKLLVQSPPMREEGRRVQAIKRERIAIVGFPQFDWYARKELIEPRETFFKKIGVPADHRLIFFGSEGAWAPNDDSVADLLAAYVSAPEARATLWIRPHYTDIGKNKFARFDGMQNVKVDSSMRYSDFFWDHWDPSEEETIFFANLLRHADALVTTTSTLTLDGACFDVPLINVAFGILYKNGRDVSEEFYKKTHYRWVLQTGAVELVRTPGELQAALESAFADRTKRAEGRARLRRQVVGPLDGAAAARTAAAALGALQ